MYDDVPFTIPPQPFFYHGVLFCNKHVHYTNVGSKLERGGGLCCLYIQSKYNSILYCH